MEYGFQCASWQHPQLYTLRGRYVHIAQSVVGIPTKAYGENTFRTKVVHFSSNFNDGTHEGNDMHIIT